MKRISHLVVAGAVIAGAAVALLKTMPINAGTETAKVDIYWNDIHQTIDGFGTAQGGSGYTEVLYNWAEPYRSQVVDLGFSQASGIGLTFLRTQIKPSLNPFPGYWDYTDTEQVWLMKEAAKRGPVKIMSSVWSPPAWMKDNGNTRGGRLRSDRYQDYANFLSRYSREYAAANGVNIHSVSMANEPDNGGIDWDTTVWESNEIARFLGDFLRPTFAQNGVTTKVVAPETSVWDVVENPSPNGNLPYMQHTYANPLALSRVDIVAGHLYGGDPAKPFQTALNNGKKIWQTETSLRYPIWNDEVDEFQNPRCPGALYNNIDCGTLKWMTDLHKGLTGAQVSGWFWWVLALWRNEYSVMALNADNSFSISKTFWAFGNYSKFIRPGFVRIGTKSSNSKLLASAYKDPNTGRFVVVVINNSSNPVNATFLPHDFTPGRVSPYITSNSQNLAKQPALSFSAPIYIPAKSVVTYTPDQPEIIWRGTDGSVQKMFVTGGAVQSQMSTGTPDSNWKIQGIGDFDGDRVNDIFWRCMGACYQSSFGQTAIWFRGQATYPTPAYPGLVSDSAWEVKGIGDFDGNGRSDVLWQWSGPANHGQLAIWFNGQAANPAPAYPAAVSDDNWKIKGIGDFDGDGASDILWQYAGSYGFGQLAIWWRGQNLSPVPSYPGRVTDGGWQIKGVGDFNGNGRSDILWQYAGQVNHGQLAVWWNGEGTGAWYPAQVPDDNWVIKGVEDFDLDQRSDVLWQFVGPTGHQPHGQLAIWFAAQSADPVPAYPGVVPDSLQFQGVSKSGL